MKPFACIALLLCSSIAATAQTENTIVVNVSAPSHTFPHFWEQMFGSGRAILTLRESYRNDLRETKKITDVRYVRFHGILLDEVGVYNEEKGQPTYNFSYVDQIYDGLLREGVRPFVELSFMPKQLAAREDIQGFWYRPNVAPPKDWGRWDDLITQFCSHLVLRYGIDETAQWYFEVWNEPNLDFWGGVPGQATYWDLYDHTARAIKSVNPRLRVGGPATAQAAWADEFIHHCSSNHIPVDFVSSHAYANDTAKDVFNKPDEVIPRSEMVCRAVRKVHDQIKASSMPGLPLIWSEFNASYKNESEVTDASYMGPWIADTIRQCDGIVDLMSYWTFSDVFEEQGVVKEPFYGGFGLLAEDGIPKPAFNTFRLLHDLGEQRIELDSDSAIVTRRKDGSLALALWNYAPPEQNGAARTFTLQFAGTHLKQASISRVDPTHGDVRAAYIKLKQGRLRYHPTQAEILELKKAAELPVPESRSLTNNTLTLTLPSYGLALVVVN